MHGVLLWMLFVFVLHSLSRYTQLARPHDNDNMRQRQYHTHTHTPHAWDSTWRKKHNSIFSRQMFIRGGCSCLSSPSPYQSRSWERITTIPSFLLMRGYQNIALAGISEKALHQLSISRGSLNLVLPNGASNCMQYIGFIRQLQPVTNAKSFRVTGGGDFNSYLACRLAAISVWHAMNYV